MIRRLDAWATKFLDVTWEHLLPVVVGVVIALSLLTVSAQIFIRVNG